MARYFTRPPRAGKSVFIETPLWDDAEPPRAGKSVFIETPLWDDAEPQRLHLSVDDHEPTFTGLLDATGEEIWRAPNPMGFGRDGDW